MRREAAVERRQFLGGTLAAGAAAWVGAGRGLAEEKPAPEAKLETKRKLKLGVLGCGSRGQWITDLFQKHGGYEIYALADYFESVVNAAGKKFNVPAERCFTGLSGYKRLIESGVEAVVIIDVPYFYPEQAKAVVEAGKHVYTAKPIAVDVPGLLMVEAAATQAAEKKLCFLVDYQLPTEPANIEVANRIREGALGPLGHIVSFGLCSAWGDPPKGATIESRLRGEVWLSDIALGGDNIVSFDIHIIDGVTWVTGKRPVGAVGRSRIIRPGPNGDRTDCGAVIYDYDDGVCWTHITQALNNNTDQNSLAASMSAGFFGLTAMAHIQYGGKVFVRGGPKHYVGNCGSIYDDGAKRNIAEFHKSISEGKCDNPTVKRALDGHYAAILGREAAARKKYLTMEELIKENKKLEVDLKGLKV